MASSPAATHAAMWLSPRNSRRRSPSRNRSPSGVPGRGWDERAGEQGPAPGLERRDGAGEQLVGAVDAVGRGAEDALELLDGAGQPLVCDGGGVGEAPAERDGRDDGLHVEHAEGGGHQLAGRLAEGRAPAREVGGAVGQRHAAGDLAGAPAEAEGGVALVALGGEVHLADERLDEPGDEPSSVAHLFGGGCGRHGWSPRIVGVAWDPTSRARAATARPSGDLLLLAVAVAAVSTVGAADRRRGRADAGHRVLAQRAQPAGARRCGCWPGATSGPAGGSARRAIGGCSRISGALLAAHFATWVPSLSFTSVASSVALVATQPVWAALIARHRGERIHRGTWIGIGLALAGTLLLTGVDLSISGRALFGDLLALVGGMFAAAYVTVGADVRRHVSTAVLRAGLLRHRRASCSSALCVASGQALVGFDRDTWLAIGGLVLGRPAPRSHAREPRAAQHQPHGRVGGDPLRDPRRHRSSPGSPSARRRPPARGRRRLLIVAGVVVVVRSDQDASDLVEPGGVLT